MPRRMDWRVMMPNQVSIWLIQDEPTGVKWKCTCGLRSQPRRDLGGGVRGQVVQHDVHVGAGVRLDRLLQEAEEVRAVAGGLALAEHLAGGHVQRGEQVRRAVPHVVVGALLGRVERDRQHRLGPVQGLDLRLLIDREHHRAAGRIQVQADHVGDLGGELPGPC